MVALCPFCMAFFYFQNNKFYFFKEKKQMNENQKEEMITQSTIIGMGWTKTMITKFLPEPTLKDNPHYQNAAPMKLWRKMM